MNGKIMSKCLAVSIESFKSKTRSKKCEDYGSRRELKYNMCWQNRNGNGKVEVERTEPGEVKIF